MKKSTKIIVLFVILFLLILSILFYINKNETPLDNTIDETDNSMTEEIDSSVNIEETNNDNTEHIDET